MGGRRERLARLREELPLEERALLVLRVGRNLEWHEVSAVLAAEGREVSVVALRKRFERLKRRLASLARERGLLA
jgi:RNA polymerase sigma-70 factor (ECF subfamily)